MPRWVHPLMENTNHVNRAAAFDIEDQVAAHNVAPVVATYLIDSPTTFRNVRDALYGLSNLANIRFCLACIPSFLGKIPD